MRPHFRRSWRLVHFHRRIVFLLMSRSRCTHLPPYSMEGSGRRCYHAEREPRLPLKTLNLPAQESKPLSGS